MKTASIIVIMVSVVVIAGAIRTVGLAVHERKLAQQHYAALLEECLEKSETPWHCRIEIQKEKP